MPYQNSSNGRLQKNISMILLILVVTAADTWPSVTLNSLILCSWECADLTAEFWLKFSFGGSPKSCGSG